MGALTSFANIFGKCWIETVHSSTLVFGFLDYMIDYFIFLALV